MRASPRLQPLMVGLTLVNFVILGATLVQGRAVADTSGGVVRGRGLEIPDDQGRMRASITLNPPVRQADGSIYPETVPLRLITAAGRPVVKLASTEDGAAMTLSAAEGPAYAQILARGGASGIVMVDSADNKVTQLP